MGLFAGSVSYTHLDVYKRQLKGNVAYAVLLAYSVASVFSLKSERISPIFGIEKDLMRFRQRQPVPCLLYTSAANNVGGRFYSIGFAF